MTLVGRRKLDHPTLGTAGGSALHASIETIYTNIGDDLGGRLKTASSIANSTVTTFEHNYGTQFADLKVLLYTGTHPNYVRVSDPVASGWTIAATAGFLKEKIDVTTPSSGGPHTFAVFIAQTRGAEKLKDLDDVDFSTSPTDGQFFIYDNAASKWKPLHLKYMEETATISSNTVTPTAGRNIQRITGSASDLHMVGSPSAGKLYVLVNETGSNITVKNDTGATAANRIYTGTGVDFTLKNNAAITLIYDSGLSRWVLAGGSGGGGLQPTPISSGLTAQAGTHYLTNTSGGAFTVTLPAGVAGSVIMVSDANETWDTFNLTVTPASGEKIDNLATNESLVCDVKRGWVELSYNTALSSWSMRSISTTQLVEASATQNGFVTTSAQTFAGVKTFNSNPVVAGGGVQFPEPQVASANANCLDDYEEGNWTPDYAPTVAGSAPSYNVSTTLGRYTKIGRKVTVIGRLQLTAKGSGTGSVRITTLPFVAANSGVYPAVNIAQFSNLSTGIVSMSGFINAGTSHLYFTHQTAAATSSTETQTSVFSDTTLIDFTATYEV